MCQIEAKRVLQDLTVSVNDVCFHLCLDVGIDLFAVLTSVSVCACVKKSSKPWNYCIKWWRYWSESLCYNCRCFSVDDLPVLCAWKCRRARSVYVGDGVFRHRRSRWPSYYSTTTATTTPCSSCRRTHRLTWWVLVPVHLVSLAALMNDKWFNVRDLYIFAAHFELLLQFTVIKSVCLLLCFGWYSCYEVYSVIFICCLKAHSVITVGVINTVKH